MGEEKVTQYVMIQWLKVSKFDGRYDFTQIGYLMNSKKNEYNSIHIETQYNQTVKRQREHPEIKRREATYHKQVVDNIKCQFLSKNDGGQKAVGWHS